MSMPGLKKHVLMDPQKLEQLEEVYKGHLTDNARLTKAARLAAKQHALLMSSDIPPSIIQALLQDMEPDVQYWTR